MLLDEFVRLYDQQPFELVNGIRDDVLPQVAGHGEVVQSLWLAIDRYAASHQLGDAFMRAPFVEVNREDRVIYSFTPGVMYIRADRLASYKQATPDWRMKPYLLVPDLVIEVVSPNDNFSELDEKVNQYLLDGVRAVWVVDPQKRRVSIHVLKSSDPFTKQETQLKETDTLKGGEIIPGFEMTVAKIFE